MYLPKEELSIYFHGLGYTDLISKREVRNWRSTPRKKKKKKKKKKKRTRKILSNDRPMHVM